MFAETWVNQLRSKPLFLFELNFERKEQAVCVFHWGLLNMVILVS